MSGGLRVIVGAAGLAGHALPALALARELGSRGHEVLVHTYTRWQPAVEDLGLGFRGAEAALADTDKAGASQLEAETRGLARSIRDFRPAIVVGDGLTLTPTLAAELEGVPRATLFPEVYPLPARGLPPFSLGLRAPRTPLGAIAWTAARRLEARLPATGWRPRARAELNAARANLGMGAWNGEGLPSGPGLTLVATFPQLEYPRAWPADVHVTGPLSHDPSHPPTELPRGAGPLVVVAPSTVKDPQGELARVAVEALADEPARVLLTTGGGPAPAGERPSNLTVADWIDYGRVMPHAALVICHGNHGTVVRALGCGAPVVVVPAMPDDAEHGARVSWAGAGLMVPRRLLNAASLRLAVRRVLDGGTFTERAGEIAAWARDHDGGATAAALVERYAREAAS